MKVDINQQFLYKIDPNKLGIQKANQLFDVSVVKNNNDLHKDKFQREKKRKNSFIGRWIGFSSGGVLLATAVLLAIFHPPSKTVVKTGYSKITKRIFQFAEKTKNSKILASTNILVNFENVRHRWITKGMEWAHMGGIFRGVTNFFKGMAKKSAKRQYDALQVPLNKIEEGFLKNDKSIPKELTELKNIYSKKIINEFGARCDELDKSYAGAFPNKLGQGFGVDYDNAIKEFFQKIRQKQSVKAENLSNIAKNLRDKNPGKIEWKTKIEKIEQEIEKQVGLLKTALSKKDVSKLEKWHKKFKDATEFEKEELDGRLRELALGGAVTEVCGPLLAIGLLTKGLIQDENKTERRSTIITEGIPILGGIGTWAYFLLVKNVNGFKPIALSVASGFVFGKIAGFIDRTILGNTEDKEEINKSIKKEV